MNGYLINLLVEGDGSLSSRGHERCAQRPTPNLPSTLERELDHEISVDKMMYYVLRVGELLSTQKVLVETVSSQGGLKRFL